MPLPKSGSAVGADAVARPRSEAAVSNRQSSASDEPVTTAGHAHAAPETGAGGAPGRSAAASSVVGQDAFPIQTTKVQRPPLRAETLRRDRLLEWLTVKIHHRIVFVTADAGYGKTTLLADFARRSRLPTLWYRLDGVVDRAVRSCRAASVARTGALGI